MAEITLWMDGVEVTVPEGTTLLKAAQQAGIIIPTICYHDFCSANGLCRMCVVEVEGARTLVASCVARVSAGMKVQTGTPRVRRVRRTILEMLAATVDITQAPEILTMMEEYQVDRQRFPGSDARQAEVLDDNPMYIRDYAKCILCWRCVQVCAADAQFTYAINFSRRGYSTQIATFFDQPMPLTTCVFCGQCVGVCPTGALRPKREYLLEQGLSAQEINNLTRSQRKRRRREESQEVQP